MQPFVAACFLLSGISGLCLEVVWTRMLEHVFGSTTLAVSTVLTCFMGGLALGSFLLGRIADRLRSPVLAYGIAEGIIGLSALVVPFVIEGAYPSLARLLAQHLSNDFLVHSVVRFAAVAAVLAIPTTCMGATLPLLSRFVMDSEIVPQRVGARVGVLYTLNTIGAIIGVFATTFLLLPTIGLAATNRCAAAINIALCLAIALSHRRLSRPVVSELGPAEILALSALEAPPVPITAVERRVAVFGFFLSGLAAMALQVVWNRAMAMIIGASVYSFALVLIAFLVGLAGGAAAVAKHTRTTARPMLLLALVEGAVALMAMANYLYMDRLPRAFALLVTSNVPSVSGHVGIIQFLMFTVACLAVLPSTFFMGMTFPLTVRVASKGLGTVGADVGRIYAANTLGAIAGSFLSAFVFVPLFSKLFNGAGMQVTFFLSVGVYAFLAIVMALAANGPLFPRLGVATVAAVTAVAFWLFAPGWDPAALTLGVFRVSLMRHALDDESWGAPDIKTYTDGVTTTVSIELWGRHVALKNNGKVDASNGDDMPTQIMVAAYPLLLHPKGPKDLDVAIVGFGSGVTVGTALEFPVRHVDTIELESAVVAASRVFGRTEGESRDPELDVNHLLYRNPVDPRTGGPNPQLDWRDPQTFVIHDRLTIHSNDGRNFLASTAKKYDVIISEPSNPWITGVSNMFTQDNFRAAAKALRQGGIYCQWVQLYELSPQNIKIILRTFASVFPHVALMSAEDLSSDTVLLGSFEPLPLDMERVSRAMDDERVRDELARAYVFEASDALARVLLVDRRELLDYTDAELAGAEAVINTDDNAVIEFAAPHDLLSFAKFSGYLSTIYGPDWPYGRLENSVQGLGTGETRAVRTASLALSLMRNGRKQRADALLLALDEPLLSVPEVVQARGVLETLQRPPTTPPPLIDIESQGRTLPEPIRRELRVGLVEVERLLALRDIEAAIERFDAIAEHVWRRAGPDVLMLEGYLHFSAAKPEDSTQCEEAIDSFTELSREHPEYLSSHPELHLYLALCHDNALHFDKAVKHALAYDAAQKLRVELDTLMLAQAQANAQSPQPGTASINLPEGAVCGPTTDAPGEQPKAFFITTR